LSPTPNSERFEILRRIGAGAMGVVFEARDRSSGSIVALKTLSEMRPAELYRFKQEFRSLVDISHPNLVTLYELFAGEELWFFTMEYLQGEEFLSAVWRGASYLARKSESGTRSTEVPTRSMGLGESLSSIEDAILAGRASNEPKTAECDYDRLRWVLREVAAGLNALHATGKLHRDIKPSNIIVTDSRAVILDFGLVFELDDVANERPSMLMAGTIAYMSPEQAAGGILTPASDWYSVGVMLFQALTGQAPHSGTPVEVLAAKRSRDAPSPRELAPGIPEDLDLLCTDLLRRNPSARPDGEEVLKRLNASEAETFQGTLTRPHVFVGRDTGLAELNAAYRRSVDGTPSVVLLRGASGVGKSALVRHFLESIKSDDVMEICGRCYEQEAVPYRAVDSAIDSLSRALLRLADEQLKQIIPRDLWALTHLFPVLRRVPLFEASGYASDAFEQRRLAFNALRELIINLSKLYQLVVHLDDLQWMDADSAALLTEVMRPPFAQHVLVVFSYRDENAESNPFIKQLVASSRQPGLVQREIMLEPLSRLESAILADRLLSGSRSTSAAVDAIARESGGNPLFVHALAADLSIGTRLRHEQNRPAGVVALDDLLWRRIQQLPADAREVLEAVAVAGSPISQSCAFQAAGHSGQDPKVVSLLRNSLFARRAGAFGSNEIDTYHDRVRESVLARLAPQKLAGYHLQLARSLEQSGSGDAEALAMHYELGGDRRTSAGFYAQAANRATEVVAFDKAAALYTKALENGTWMPEERHRLRVKLAGSLADAGRGLAAARAYEEASRSAPPAERSQLERRAAFHYLSSGHIDEGYSVSERVLARYGLTVPRSELRSLASLASGHLRLRLRGLDFEPRSEDEVPAEILASIDAALEIGEGLGMLEVVPAMTVHLTGLLNALKAGEPSRIARTLAIVSCQMSATKKAELRGHYKPLIALARRIAEGLDDPLLLGYCNLSDTITLLNQGRYLEQYESAVRAEDYFLKCRGVAWHLATMRTFRLYALLNLGRFQELGRACEALMKEGSDRGDLYFVTNVSTLPLPIALIARDQPAEARRVTNEAIGQWTVKSYTQQHLMNHWALTHADLYAGDWRGALKNSEAQWFYMRKTLEKQVNNLRFFGLDARGRSSLAAALFNSDKRGLMAAAIRDIEALEGEYFPVAHTLAKSMRAGLADLEGNRELAVRFLREALAGADALDMAGYSAAMRLRLASLIGGDEGRELKRQCETWAASEDVRNLDSFKRLYTSGFSEDRS
jgi:serine/threonine protein kinase